MPAELSAFSEAARVIAAARALLITAGAGIGVDSGLPNFRGPEGFWRAYPAFRNSGRRFEELANPSLFRTDPHLAWGFYAHRLALYRRTTPHPGFQTLLRLAKAKPAGHFVFTSNVDGQFQTAGFPTDRILEGHGSLHFFQCTRPCSDAVWTAPADIPDVDLTTMQATDPLPPCPHCGGLARPNLLMFGDRNWIDRRTEDQWSRYDPWRIDPAVHSSLVIVEIGAGEAIRGVRLQSERLVRQYGAKLIRINPFDADVPAGQISLPHRAAEALEALAQLLVVPDVV